jgi:ABC-type glutathione transport system ATPase component
MSPNAKLLAECFDIPPADRHAPQFPDLRPPAPGQILLITGPSGSGKSTLFRNLRDKIPPDLRINLDAIQPPDCSVIDCFGDVPLSDSLGLLSRVGLAEAHTWLLTPSQLSTGQLHRLRLALALYAASSAGAATLICDEFTSPLDDLSAVIFSAAVRRSLKAHPALAAIFASHRKYLAGPLEPHTIVACDFGEFQITESAP